MSTLVLNIGNTSLFGGVCAGSRIGRRFRVPVREAATPRGFKKLVAAQVRGPFDAVALCSVVPALTETFVRHIETTWGCTPQVLTAAADHGLEIGYRRPHELGTDRPAAAVGARALFPRRNVIVVDCGTATTITALTRAGRIAGGAILPGLALWSEMLAARTAQLPEVLPVRRPAPLGRSPREAIASGLFHGHAGAIRELVQVVAREAFGKAPAVVVGTGGNAPRFAREKLFTELSPDLILIGLRAFAARTTSHA